MPARATPSPILEAALESGHDRLLRSLLDRPSSRAVHFDPVRRYLVWRRGGKERNLAGLEDWLSMTFTNGGSRSDERDDSRRPSSRRRGNSSRKAGISVHRQLEHWVNCQRDGACSCGLQARGQAYRGKRTWSPLTQRAWLALDRAGLVPLRAEVALACERAGRGTRLDLLCGKKAREQLVLVSLKTGLPPPGAGAQAPRLRPPFDALPDEPASLHHLQLFYERLLLDREHGTAVASAAILYLIPPPRPQAEAQHFWQRLDARLDAPGLQDRAYACLLSGTYEIPRARPSPSLSPSSDV